MSRKRKGAKRKIVPANLPIAEEGEQWKLKIDAAKLIYLKSNPDFLSMIKIGRAINAVSFALTEVINRTDDDSIVGKRQYRRSCLVLAGYLHQAVTLVLSIKGRYLTDPGFEPLRLLVLDTEHKKVRDYVRKIRNFTAFHLDEFDELTRKTLSRLKLTSYTLLSVDESEPVPYYFDLADEIDMAFLIDHFSVETDRDQTRLDILQAIIDYSSEFINACNDFEVALGKKVNILEYTYSVTA